MILIKGASIPKFLRTVFFVAFSLVCSNVSSQTEKSYPFVISGVVVNSENRELFETFTNWLTEKTQYPLHVVYAKSYQDLSNIMRGNPNSMGWTCSAPFIEDHQDFNQKLVSVPLFKNEPTYHSVVLTQSSRIESKIEDFKNQIIAYSDVRSNSGFLAPSVALKKRGFDMASHFKLMINAGNHEGSISALIGGLADVAAVDEYVLVEYLKQRPEDRNKLKEVERFGPFPFTPIVASNRVNKKTIQRFRQVLETMDQDPQGARLLKTFGLDGFVTKPIAFFAPIGESIKFLEK